VDVGDVVCDSVFFSTGSALLHETSAIRVSIAKNKAVIFFIFINLLYFKFVLFKEYSPFVNLV
jgi:hypothetical protein